MAAAGRQRATAPGLAALAAGLLLGASAAPAPAAPIGEPGPALPLTPHDLIRLEPEAAWARLVEVRERLRHRQTRHDLTLRRLAALDAEIAELTERWREIGAALRQQRGEVADLDRRAAALSERLDGAEAALRRLRALVVRALCDLALRCRGDWPADDLGAGGAGRRPLGAMMLAAWRADEAAAAALRRRRDALAERRTAAAAELVTALARANAVRTRLADRSWARIAARAAVREARDRADVAAAELEALLADLNRAATYRLAWTEPPADRAVLRFVEEHRSPFDHGVTIEPPGPGRTVTAPAAGRVVFAGPFRSYGLLLIIEHGGGYHSLLSGMSRLTVGVDQWVRTGEPVGAFGDFGETHPHLYVELRRNGRPVNPLSWLAAGHSKVSG